jgi:SAM-dependent methyltransferase
MPVNVEERSQQPLYQRRQYAKSLLGRSYWDYRNKVAASLLEDSDRTIVDLGCGEGIALEMAASMFPHADVFGVDYLEENIEICSRYGLRAIRGDLYDLELPDGSVDAALLQEVIEHLRDPDTAVREVHRILRPGGKFILVFPNDRTWQFVWRILLRFREANYDYGHVRQWTPRSARQFLTERGFDVYYSRPTPLPIWSIALDAVVAGRKRER